MYAYIFGKTNKDFTRYWANISTEAVNEDGEGTGDYYQASITVRMSKKALKTFEKAAKKTATKGIVGANLNIEDFWLKAGKPYEDDEGNEHEVLILFINKFEVPEKPEQAPAKARGAKKATADDAEDD